MTIIYSKKLNHYLDKLSVKKKYLVFFYSKFKLKGIGINKKDRRVWFTHNGVFLNMLPPSEVK